MVRNSIEEKCWADAFGGCSGPITEEHVITKGLLGKQIKVRGGIFGDELSVASLGRLKARILCQGHNNEFGRTADLAAQQLVKHLQTSQDPLRLPGSRILRPPVAKQVSGTNFGRWLCKTHCNLMVINGKLPDPAYVAYAVQRGDPQTVYFYLPVAKGETLLFLDHQSPIFQWHQHVGDEPTSQFDGFEITLVGLPTVVSTTPLLRGTLQMLDRVRVLEWRTALGHYQVRLDWTLDTAR